MFRIGGEEFCFLISAACEQIALAFAEKIRYNIEQLKIEHKEGLAANVVTVSIGLVYKEFANDDSIPDENCIQALLKEADLALYQAKKNGRNQCVLFN